MQHKKKLKNREKRVVGVNGNSINDKLSKQWLHFAYDDDVGDDFLSGWLKSLHRMTTNRSVVEVQLRVVVVAAPQLQQKQ